MKTFVVFACLAANALAAPTATPQTTTSSDTANDVTNGVCKAITYIFARGTTETGNIGITVGPGLKTALETSFGADKVATQGVTYPADTAGAVTGYTSPADAEGAKTMASLTQQALKACPSTKVILAGYSQGAEQVHGALDNLSAGDVTVALTFGDPLYSSANKGFENIDASATKVYCADGDAVCSGEFVISAAHLSYAADDCTPAAEFAKGVIGSV